LAAPNVTWSDEKASAAAEMARKLQDPLSNIAALTIDSSFLFKTGDNKTSYSFQIQPVYAIDSTEQGFTFIPRAVIPIVGAARKAICRLWVSQDRPAAARRGV